MFLKATLSIAFLALLGLTILGSRHAKAGIGETPLIYKSIFVKFVLNIFMLMFVGLSIFILFFYSWKLFLILLAVGFVVEGFFIVSILEKIMCVIFNPLLNESTPSPALENRGWNLTPHEAEVAAAQCRYWFDAEQFPETKEEWDVLEQFVRQYPETLVEWYVEGMQADEWYIKNMEFEEVAKDPSMLTWYNENQHLKERTTNKAEVLAKAKEDPTFLINWLHQEAEETLTELNSTN